MSFQAVLINRLGEHTQISYRNQQDLTKKFKFKGSGVPSGYKFEDYNNITILGFKNGKEPLINKTELPPPIDQILFYGDLIAYIPNENLSVENFSIFYETIFGFEDLDDTLLEDELFDQDDEYDLSDSFIASEDEEEED